MKGMKGILSIGAVHLDLERNQETVKEKRPKENASRNDPKKQQNWVSWQAQSHRQAILAFCWIVKG